MFGGVFLFVVVVVVLVLLFVCLRFLQKCSGVHRSLGVHISKVRSADLDEWEEHQYDTMAAKGNEKQNELYEWSLLRNGGAKITPDSSTMDREQYIRQKWQYCAFADPRRVNIPVPLNGGAAVALADSKKSIYREGFLTKQGNKIHSLYFQFVCHSLFCGQDTNVRTGPGVGLCFAMHIYCILQHEELLIPKGKSFLARVAPMFVGLTGVYFRGCSKSPAAMQCIQCTPTQSEREVIGLSRLSVQLPKRAVKTVMRIRWMVVVAVMGPYWMHKQC
jgi:hypothetical protein